VSGATRLARIGSADGVRCGFVSRPGPVGRAPRRTGYHLHRLRSTDRCPARYSNWQRRRIQNPYSVGSNPTRATDHSPCYGAKNRRLPAKMLRCGGFSLCRCVRNEPVCWLPWTTGSPWTSPGRGGRVLDLGVTSRAVVRDRRRGLRQFAHLIAALALTIQHTAAHILAWSRWGRRKNKAARQSHYRRRDQPEP
jgi:hypothetical protein